MRIRLLIVGILWTSWLGAQSQIDLTKQTRNALPYGLGGTNATNQVDARRNVGTPEVVATDFAGADLGAQVNAAFASFGANKCGTVVIPTGSYTYSTEIVVPSTCILTGVGRAGANTPPDTDATELIYNGPAATSAISLEDGRQITIQNLYIRTNLGSVCPNSGNLRWNPSAGGANKWQCYDGTVYSAPAPHLAGIRFGSLDPNALSGGTHNILSNVEVNGGGTSWPGSQGAFNFGFLINGCQSCTIQSAYADANYIGFLFGGASNGLLVNQATARVNRRAGMQYKGSNRMQCNMCLLESNTWVGHAADPTKYGVGLLAGDDIYGIGRGFKMFQGYFEANDVDVANFNTALAAGEFDGFQTIRGVFGSSGDLSRTKFTDCVIPDGSLVTSGPSSTLINGCATTGTVVKGNSTTYVVTDPTGTLVSEIWRNDTSGVRPTHKFYEVTMDGTQTVYLRDQIVPGGGVTTLRLDNSQVATATENADSATLKLAGKKWIGGVSTEYLWSVHAGATTLGNSPETTDGLYFTSGGVRHVSLRKASDGAFTQNVMAHASQGSTKLWVAQNSSGTDQSWIRGDGAFQTQPSAAKPTCDANARFTFWTVAGGSGVKDTVEVCAKDAAGAFAWRTLY